MYRKTARETPEIWDGYVKPFHLAGPIYYVGVYQVCTHLIDTGDGLVLIDAGYENMFYMIIDSIHRLGFDPMDIKYVISTHWHGDHTGANACCCHLTGAKLVMSDIDADAPKLTYPADIRVKDGDTLTLGNITFRFVHTPGHTKGTMSIFFDFEEDGKTYTAGTFGGAGMNTLKCDAPTYYPTCCEDFMKSCDRLDKEHVDVFFGNHTWNNNTEVKGLEVLAGNTRAFYDENEFPKFVEFRRQACIKRKAKNDEMLKSK